MEEVNFGADAREFVENDFYVDDGLKSTSTTEEAVALLKRIQAMSATANLRLHKIASNDSGVTSAFPVEDLDLSHADMSASKQTIQCSLGVSWDLKTDSFTFKVSMGNKPFTKRRVLSVINSLCDPWGMAAPVLIQGKSLLCRAVARALIGGGCIFIYSGAARLVSFEIKLISKEVNRAEPEYMNIHPPN